MNKEAAEQKPNSEVLLIIKNTFILFAITAIAGLLLSVAHSMTEAPIAAQAIIQRDNALNAVLPDATFEELTVADAEKYSKILQVFAGKDSSGNIKGYAFMLTNKGYGGAVTLVAGIGADDKISGIDIISHSETPGLGANADRDFFKDEFKDKAAEQLAVSKSNNDGQNIEALSGATITSTAVVGAVNEAVEYYRTQLKGGN